MWLVMTNGTHRHTYWLFLLIPQLCHTPVTTKIPNISHHLFMPGTTDCTVQHVPLIHENSPAPVSHIVLSGTYKGFYSCFTGQWRERVWLRAGFFKLYVPDPRVHFYEAANPHLEWFCLIETLMFKDIFCFWSGLIICFDVILIIRDEIKT